MQDTGRNSNKDSNMDNDMNNNANNNVNEQPLSDDKGSVQSTSALFRALSHLVRFHKSGP